MKELEAASNGLVARVNGLDDLSHEDYFFPWKHSPGVTSLTLPESTPQRLPDLSKGELLEKLREAFNGDA